MARSRYEFGDPDRPHFLTCTVFEWLPVFTRQDAVEIVLDTWRYQQAHEDLKLIGYVILENHLHAVAQAPNLPDTWTKFKSYSAKKIIELLQSAGARQLLHRLQFAFRAGREGRKHQFWQEGSHPQVIESREMMLQKLEYIHNNPVKRGYVDEPEHWRWSSARVYSGQEGLIEVYREW